MIKILFLAPKNTFELLLSSEIGQFEVEELNFLENPYISLCTNSKDFQSKSMENHENLLDFKLIYLGAQGEFESVLGR